ncbi:MAG TPA: [LysW]-aminoadipate kinase [Chloroflexi bacterium]|nr:[LysW]-aminoadipate kinase [Chloroflexota bacterium]
MIVVKAGGNGGVDTEALCADIVELARGGERVILAHGGSHEVNRVSEKLGHPPQFVTSVSGHVSRYTDRGTLEIFVMVTAGRVNKMLVERLQQLGANAIGLSGLDGRLLEAERKPALRVVENGKRKVLRGDHSGRILRVNVHLLRDLLDAGYLPVVAPVAIGGDGHALNVDGDRVASAISAAMKADTLIILSNVPGLLRNFPDEGTLIERVSLESAQRHLDSHAQGRMKKKMLGAMEAARQGVARVVIADGRVENPVQRALAGHGTAIEGSVASSGSTGAGSAWRGGPG